MAIAIHSESLFRTLFRRIVWAGQLRFKIRRIQLAFKSDKATTNRLVQGVQGISFQIIRPQIVISQGKKS